MAGGRQAQTPQGDKARMIELDAAQIKAGQTTIELIE